MTADSARTDATSFGLAWESALALPTNRHRPMLRRIRRALMSSPVRRRFVLSPARLAVLELEDRNLMAVSASLAGGVLSVQFTADDDTATLALAGADLTVSDGSTSKSFAAGSIASIALVGTTGDNQSVTIGASLGLSGTFTSNGVESVTFAKNVFFGARSTVSHAIAVVGAHSITVGAGATLWTRGIAGNDPLSDESTANSGNVSFSAKSIAVEAGARILAHATGGFQAGDVTIAATAAQLDAYMTPLFNEKTAAASVTVGDNAVIRGRNVTFSTDAAAKRYTIYDLGTLATKAPTLANQIVGDGLTFTPGRDDGSTGPTITRTNGTWSGFAAGQTIAISGTPNGLNDGRYDVESVSTDSKSLVLVTSDALRQQTVNTGTDVTVRAVDTSLPAESVPFVAVDENGQAVQPQSTQGDVTKNAAPPVGWNPVLSAINGLPLPAQVTLTTAHAKTTIGNGVAIAASGNVSVSAKAAGNTRSQLPSLVFGITWAESDVQAITTIGNATITAGGSFSATSDVNNQLKAVTKTLGGTVQNPASGDAIALPGPSISVAVARGISVSTVETADGTSITAAGITIGAAMTNKFANESSATTSNAKSLAGSVGVAIADHSETARATLRGTVVSTGDVAVTAEGTNEAVENRTEASVNTDDPEPASPMFGLFTKISDFLGDAKDKQDDKSKNDQSKEGESGTTLQIAGAVVVAFSDFSVESSIARNAIVSVEGGALEVTATGESAPQASAVGSAEANSKLAVGGAFIYGDYSMDVKAWIGDGAVVNVDHGITVSAESSQIGGFPTSWGDFVGGVVGLRDTGLPWVSDGSTKSFSDAVSKSGAFLDTIDDVVDRGQAISEGDWSFLLQEFSVSFVSASARPGEVTDKDGNVSGKSNAASGNFDMVFAKSHATAWIGEGVQINQTTPNADADEQSVSVSATTEAKALYFGGLTGQGNPFGYTTVGGNGAIGGVYAHHDYDMLAKAYIADGAKVKAAKDVAVEAENNLIVGVWDFAGSSGKNFAVQGTFTVTPVDSQTLAYIENSAIVDAGGDVAISAATDQLFITFTGAIAKSDKVGVGAGLGYFDVDSTTKAFVGNVTTSAAYPGAGTITVGGDLDIAAENSILGITVGISAALATTPDEPPPPPPPTLDEILDDGATLTNLFALPDEQQPTNTKQESEANQKTETQKRTGFGLSASLGLNLFDTVTFAGIDSTTVAATGNVSVVASSDELFIVATGAAALNLDTKADSSTALAGALSWNDLDRDVIAKVNNATISSADLTVNAEASSLLVSLTAGAAITSPAQKAKTSVGIAGSANVNDLDTTVSATLAGTTKVTATGDVAVTANHELLVVSVAGGLSVSQRAGVGAAFDLGFLKTTVEAKVGDGIAIDAGGDVSVEAFDDQFFVSIGASVGVGTQKLGLAGSASWLNIATDVTASLGNNVSVTSGGDMKVTADETLFAFGLGGAAGFGKDSGFGAGLAGMNIRRNVNATIGTGGTIVVAGTAAAGDHGLFVRAFTEDDLYLIGAGGAVGATKAALAGSLALLIDTTTTNASIGKSTTVSQPAGKSGSTMSAIVEADHDSNVLAVGGAFSIGKSAALGLGVVVMPMTHTTTASIADSANISANNDIRIRANHAFDADNFAVALSGGLGGVGAAGAGVIQPLTFTTTATAGASSTLFANGNIVITADAEYDMLAIAGQGAIGVGGSGVGVSNVTTVRNETVRAEAGNNAVLTALGNKGTFAAADDATANKAVRGLIITSTLDDDVVVVAAGVAAGTSGAGIAGSVAVTVQTTNVTSRIGTGATVTANAADRAAANAAQETYLYAEHLADHAGAGGGGGFGSSGGFGAGVDVGTVNRTTRAIIDDSANVYSRGDISVRAIAGGDWISVGASVGGGGTAGIAGSASVQVHTVTTQARIGANATAFSAGNIVVATRDELQIDGIAGQISIGGTAGVGGSVPVVVVTKTTDASIGDGAAVDALGNTSAYQAQVTPPSVAFTDPLFFARSGVNTTSNQINLGYTHGFQTGDSVTYWANGTAIGGLENGGTYYAIVVDSKTIRLAKNETNADAGTAIDLTSTGTSDRQSITAYGEVAAPSVNNDGATGDNLSKRRTLSLGSTGVRGVVVSAISLDEIATYGISGGGGGTVGVQIVASVSIPTITTTATIGGNAKVNQSDLGANAGQSVTVAAIADYDRLGIGGSLAIGGTAGIAPLADVLVSKHTTKASIGSSAKVGAERDIIVAAHAAEDVRAFVIGVAGAGTAAVAGSVGVIILKTQTQATVGASSQLYALGNAVVSANDVTDATVVVGAVALGIGAAGVGASVNVSVIEKDTLARIADNATVTALAGGSGISAYTGDGLTKSSVQGVIVQASSDEDILNVVVAGGAGLYAGVAGAVNVNVLTANTSAQLGNNVVVNGSGTADADQSVYVAAIDTLELDVIGGAAGLGAAGVAGGVDVGIIRSNTNATVGTGATVNAASHIGIGSASTRDVDSLVIGASAGAGALAASVAVYSLYATVDTASKNSLNGSGGSNGATYADSATKTNVISDGLGSYNQSSTFEGGKQLANAGNSAKSSVVANSPSGVAAGAVNAAPTPSGTTTTVGNGAKILAGGNISILASDTVAIEATTGSGAVGAAGIGASVTYVTVGGQSLASVGDSVTLGGDTVKVGASYSGDGDAESYGGAAGGFVGIGAQVAILTDQHNETAKVGSNATVTAKTKFSIATNSNRTLDTSNAGGGVSLGFAAGASYAQIDSKGSASATLGANGVVSAGAGGVDISANSNTNTDANAVGVAAGAAAINLTLAEVKVSASTTASIGSGTAVTSAGDVNVKATYSAVTDLDAVGVSGGVFSAGAMDVKYTDTSTVSANLNAVGKFDVMGSLAVEASANNGVVLDTVGTSVGAVGGNGAVITATATPTVTASVGSSGGLVAANDLSVIARAGANYDAETTGVSVGGLAVGVSRVTLGWSPTVTTTVMADTDLSAGKNLTVRSLVNYDRAGAEQTTNIIKVKVTSISGSLVGGSGANVDVDLKPVAGTTVGAGANLIASRTLRIGSDVRSRTNVDLFGLNAGVLTIGSVSGTVDIDTASTVAIADSTLANPTRLSGGNDLIVRAAMDHGGRSNVSGGGGGAIASSGANMVYTLSGTAAGSSDAASVSVSIGKNTVVLSSGTVDLGTFVKLDFESDNSQTNGGFFANNDTDASTVSRYDATVTIGDSTKIGTRNLRVTTNQNVRSDVDTDAAAVGVGFNLDTDARSDVFARNRVTVNAGTSIVATGFALLENSDGSVYIRADSYGRGAAFAANVSADSQGTRSVDGAVSVASGVEIVSPTVRVQSLRPTGGRDVTADSTNVSLVGFFVSLWNAITGGDVGRTTGGSDSLANSVALNAAITLGSPRNATLTIDANGGITNQNWATATIQTDRVIVDDVYSIPGERLDVRAPGGTTSGTSTVSYGAMETVTITNASPKMLFINNIETFIDRSTTPTFNHEASTANWSYTKSSTADVNGETTKVVIRNTATGTGYDVVLAGHIDAPAGSVDVSASGGDVYSATGEGYVNSRVVTLNATAGALGRTATPIFLRTPEQKNAALAVGIVSAHGQNGGHLDVTATSPTATTFTYRVQNVTSGTGTMKIVAHEGSTTVRSTTTQIRVVDGSSYQGTLLGPLAFNPATALNAATDTITLPYAHQLANGDRAQYQPLGVFPIGGVAPFIDRQVRVSGTTGLQFSANFATGSVSDAKDAISFTAPHGYATGEAVVYDRAGNTAVSGYADGTTYYPWVYDANTVQLYNSSANAKATSNAFRADAVQTITNPAYDDKATSGIATLKTLSVIALSVVNPYATGTKIAYWTFDSNTIQQTTGANTVSVGSLSYFHTVTVPLPTTKNKDETDAQFNDRVNAHKGLVALAATAADAADGKLVVISKPATITQEPHYLRSVAGLVTVNATPTTGQTHYLRSDLSQPILPGPGFHVIDTNSLYIQDAKGTITRISRDDVRSVRDVISETVSIAASAKTTVEIGTISSSAGNVHVEVGTNSAYDTDANIVDKLSAPVGTFKIEVDGGSLVNATTKTNLNAKTADLTAWDNIGSESKPITGTVQYLKAQAGLSGTGGIWFENTGNLTLQGLKAVDDIMVHVVDRAGAADNLTVEANTSVESTAGIVYLKAGDQLFIPASAKVSAPNGINFYTNYGNAEGTSGLIDLRGFVGAKVINVYGDANTVDTILDSNDMNFEIGDNVLRRYNNKVLDTTFNLFNVTGDHFDITGGSLDNTINVTDWTGTGIFDGKAGLNRVVAVNDVDFTLADDALSRTGHGDIAFLNNTVRRAALTGGAGVNTFTVTDWSYQALLDGAGGTDSLIDVNDVNYVLSDSSMARSTVGNFDLRNIEHAELTSGSLDNRFEVSEWTGTTKLDGGAGLNSVATVRDGDYDLSNTSLTREIGGTVAGIFDLANIAKSLLIGGTSDNTFNLTGWTGQAAVDGATGQDRVASVSNSDAILNADFLGRGDGMQVQVANVETAVLLGGTDANAFLVEGWTGSVLVDGKGGGDKLMVNANTDYTLTATSIQLGNGTTIDVANLTKVTLNGGNEDNAIVVEEQPDFYTVIRAGGGDNSVRVSAAGDFNLTGSSLAIDGVDRYVLDGVDRISLVGTAANNDFLIDGWVGGLAVRGGAGTDTVHVVADTDFVLTAGEINLGTGHTIDLFEVEGAVLHGGDADNRFEINGWVGTATIVGGRGIDVVTALAPSNVRITDGLLEVQDGPTVLHDGIERAVLIGLPGKDHTYAIEHFSGAVSIIGAANAFDRLTVLSAGSFDLQAGHLVLGTGGTVDFSGIDFTVLQGSPASQNFFNIGGGTGAVSLIGGDSGIDQVRIVADADFVLDDSVARLSDGTTIHLNDITKATLIGGPGDNVFDVSGWTGYASIDGVGGTDTVVSANDTNFVLTADVLQRADGAVFGLTGIEKIRLTGGTGDNRFIVEDWSGRVDLDGGNGGDEYVISLDGQGHSHISIDDTGTGGNDALTVVLPPDSSPLVTLLGVWLGGDGVEFEGIEDFDLV